MKKIIKNRWLIRIAAILALFVVIWLVLRLSASVECTYWKSDAVTVYTEEQKVIDGVALSYLVYGCEGCEDLSGSAADILDTQRMGIIIENADISRTDPQDPASALIDSKTFIQQFIGDFRFLCDLKDTDCSFYGAAFADDQNQVVWITYSGSVSFKDTLQCLLLAAGPGLSGQEKNAFKLYEEVLKTEEIQSGYQLILTGHSLGGALATMVSYMSGAEAVTISGADGLAMNKISGISKSNYSSYRIANYVTSPDGFGFTFKDCIQRMMFWGNYDEIECHVYQDNGMVDNSHCPFGFVQFKDGELMQPAFVEKE